MIQAVTSAAEYIVCEGQDRYVNDWLTCKAQAAKLSAP